MSLSLTTTNNEEPRRKDDDVDAQNENEAKLIKGVIEKLLDQTRPSFITLRLQFHFAKHYRDRGYLFINFFFL